MNKEFKSNLLSLKQVAFTLAETLIVMGIIGVVAALTLPNLNSSTANKEKVVKLQKIYSNLNDAYGRATAVYGPIDTWPKDGDHSDRFASRIQDFMKVTKFCDREHVKECINGVANPAIILPDGASMLFWADFNRTPGELKTLGPDIGTIEVDLDGPNKGKNEFGIDMFSFLITKDNGIIPRYSEDNRWFKYPDTCFSSIERGHECCTAWVIENGNMDYLNADETGKCKNSDRKLSETVTSCK